jgi:RNA polymerase sigma-70 factor, ECF subfamily
MDATHQSILVRARGGDDSAWQDLCRVYRPLIVGWLRRQSIPASDRDDLVQEILLTVVRGLPSFQHSGQPGSFRSWLRTIAHSRSFDYWKSPARRASAPGAGAAVKTLADLEDPDSALNRFWAEEHDRYVLRCLLDMMELEFEPCTVHAFRRVALDGATGAEAAAELATTVAAVYAARSRVLRRLREVARGLIDEFT